MDVGESPVDESQAMCTATLAIGTMSLCMEPAATMERPDGKIIVVTRLLEGGNKGGGTYIPLCERHVKMWDKNPGSFEVAIPPTKPLKNQTI